MGWDGMGKDGMIGPSGGTQAKCRRSILAAGSCWVRVRSRWAGWLVGWVDEGKGMASEAEVS